MATEEEQNSSDEELTPEAQGEILNNEERTLFLPLCQNFHGPLQSFHCRNSKGFSG